MIVNVSNINGKNIGDIVCPPYLYFDIGGKHRSFVREKIPSKKHVLTIWGGGAIVNNADKYVGNKILWGAGLTHRYKHGKEWLHRENMPDYILYGSRDYGYGDWVPCPSCMSPIFDNPPEPTRNHVQYGHFKCSPLGFNNNDMDLKKVIDYLASAETIYTTSYHGMYWGILLGRKVVAMPFGSKFYGLPYDVTLVKSFDGQKGKSFPNALKECRQANIDFYAKAKPIIEQFS